MLITHNKQFPPQGIIWPQTSGVLRLCNPPPINTVVVAHLDVGSDPRWMRCSVVKSCLTLSQPRRLYPARFLCPWDSPDNNTGVGCHFLLQGLPNPRIEPGSPALQADSLLSEPPGKPEKLYRNVIDNKTMLLLLLLSHFSHVQLRETS